jgi:hypothetical protein
MTAPSNASRAADAAAVLSPAAEDYFSAICVAVEETATAPELKAFVHGVVEDLFAPGEERLRDALIGQFEAFFDKVASENWGRTRQVDFAVKMLHLVVAQRVRGGKDDWPFPKFLWRELPLTPTSIVVVEPPAPRAADGFEELLGEAICLRMASVTTFFQRRNPDVHRELPPPFPLVPEFTERLCTAVRAVVVPQMTKIRRVAVIGHARSWDGVDSEEFWRVLAADDQLGALCAAWDMAWDALKLRVDVLREKGAERRVLKAPPGLKAFRAAMASDRYALKVDNGELAFFASLLRPGEDRPRLDRDWVMLRQIYEQEMDRRQFQDRGRTGALRDTLLDLLQRMPDRTGELLVMLCYYNFPKLSLGFLVDFTRNKGANREERLRRVPHLMAFLDAPEVPGLLEREAVRERAKSDAEARRRRIERDL